MLSVINHRDAGVGGYCSLQVLTGSLRVWKMDNTMQMVFVGRLGKSNQV